MSGRLRFVITVAVGCALAAAPVLLAAGPAAGMVIPDPSGSAAAAKTATKPAAKRATKSPETHSTSAISDVVNPLSVPKGKLGSAILKATEGS